MSLILPKTQNLARVKCVTQKNANIYPLKICSLKLVASATVSKLSSNETWLHRRVHIP